MGINYPIFPLSFIQINNKIKEEIYKNILNIVKNYDCVIDAYSGAGLLSALISKQNKKVYAIEIDESASNACVELCKINNIKNVKSICGRCEDNIPKILNEQKIDCAVLDPARKGVDALTLQSIKNNNIETIVYLSCNPATLCRDLKILCEDEKYIIEFVQPYDMFPQTSEVETLVVLNINKN